MTSIGQVRFPATGGVGEAQVVGRKNIGVCLVVFWWFYMVFIWFLVAFLFFFWFDEVLHGFLLVIIRWFFW